MFRIDKCTYATGKNKSETSLQDFNFNPNLKEFPHLLFKIYDFTDKHTFSPQKTQGKRPPTITKTMKHGRITMNK